MPPKGCKCSDEHRRNIGLASKRRWNNDEMRRKMSTDRIQDILKRFWDKVDIKGPNECWVWKAGKHPQGYGQFRINHKSCGAHRISYLLTNGKLTLGKTFVLHKCDNPSCVNPNHLFAGSQLDNIADREIKGRGRVALGERQHLAKLTKEQVISIRINGLSLRKTAKIYGIDYTTVSNIRIRKTWKHIA